MISAQEMAARFNLSQVASKGEVSRFCEAKEREMDMRVLGELDNMQSHAVHRICRVAMQLSASRTTEKELTRPSCLLAALPGRTSM